MNAVSFDLLPSRYRSAQTNAALVDPELNSTLAPETQEHSELQLLRPLYLPGSPGHNNPQKNSFHNFLRKRDLSADRAPGEDRTRSEPGDIFWDHLDGVR